MKTLLRLVIMGIATITIEGKVFDNFKNIVS
jgi:hypothetical protein